MVWRGSLRRLDVSLYISSLCVFFLFSFSLSLSTPLLLSILMSFSISLQSIYLLTVSLISVFFPFSFNHIRFLICSIYASSIYPCILNGMKRGLTRGLVRTTLISPRRILLLSLSFLCFTVRDTAPRTRAHSREVADLPNVGISRIFSVPIFRGFSAYCQFAEFSARDIFFM